MIKDAENAVLAGVQAAHKMAVDAHILPAAKTPAHAEANAAKPAALTTTDKPAAKPETAHPATAAKPEGLTTTDKPAAKPETKAEAKPADQSFAIQDIIGAAVGNGLNGAAQLFSSALDCLPNLHLTDSKPAEAHPAPTAKPTTTNANDRSNAAIDTGRAIAMGAGAATGLFGGALLGLGGIEAGKIAHDAVQTGFVNIDLEKSFAKVEHKTTSTSLSDYLASSGCSMTGNGVGGACAAPTKTGLGDLFGTSAKLTTGKITENNMQQTSAATAHINGDAWDSIAHAKSADHRDKPTEASRNSEKTADGFVHKDSTGKVDFERHGDIETRHLPDGSISTLNVRTHEKTLTDKNGKLLFTYDADGVNGHTPDGTVVTFKPHSADVTIKPKDGPEIKARRTPDGFMQVTMGDTDIISSREAALTNIGEVPAKVRSLFNGHAAIEVNPDSKIIRSKDGKTTLYVGNDGTSAMTLDEHSQVVRFKDNPDQMLIVYNDGRQPLRINVHQLDGVIKDPKTVAALKFVVESLRRYGQTGTLADQAGNKITTDAQGNTVATTADAAATTNAKGQTVASSPASSESVVLDSKAQTVTLVNKKTGEQQGVVDFKDPKSPGFTTDAYSYHNNKVTTVTGDVYGPEDIKFHDGFQFCNDGTIHDQKGNVFNGDGDLTFDNERSHSGSKSTSEAVRASESSRAHAQVSQAESIASSIRARVASGHVSSSDIAALYSQMSSLSAMVGSLSQIDDSSLLVSAMIAKDEIAGSLDQANSTLSQRHQQRAVMENLAAATQPRGTGAPVNAA